MGVVVRKNKIYTAHDQQYRPKVEQTPPIKIDHIKAGQQKQNAYDDQDSAGYYSIASHGLQGC